MKRIILSAVAIATLGISASGAEIPKNILDLINAKKAELLGQQQKAEAKEAAAAENLKMKNEQKEITNNMMKIIKENHHLVYQSTNEDVDKVMVSMLQNEKNFLKNAVLLDMFINLKDAYLLNRTLDFKADDADGAVMKVILDKRLEKLNALIPQNDFKIGIFNSTFSRAKDITTNTETVVDAAKPQNKLFFSAEQKNDVLENLKAKAIEKMAIERPAGLNKIGFDLAGLTEKRRAFEVKSFGDEDFKNTRASIELIKSNFKNEFEAIKKTPLRNIFDRFSVDTFAESMKEKDYPYKNLYEFDMWKSNISEKCFRKAASWMNFSIDGKELNECTLKKLEESGNGFLKDSYKPFPNYWSEYWRADGFGLPASSIKLEDLGKIKMTDEMREIAKEQEKVNLPKTKSNRTLGGPDYIYR